MTVLSSSRPLRTGAAVAISGAMTGVFAGLVYSKVHGDRMAPWILGRATGVVSYLLLVALVVLGLSLADPRRAMRGRSAPTRMRAHVTLALLTLASMVLHVVILATDRYAGVGWPGALLPMHASYRPVPVTLGVVGVWIGVLAGVSAALAGRLPLRMWFPLHRVAGVSFVLVVLHGLLAGSDSRALLSMYLLTGALVCYFAAKRYFSRTAAQ